MLYRSYANNVTRPSTMAMRIKPVRISILQVLFRACACGRKRSLAFRATEQKHVGKLCGGCSHVVLLVGTRGAKGTEGFRTEQLSTRRVIIPFLMPRTFSAINQGFGDYPTKAQRDLRYRGASCGLPIVVTAAPLPLKYNTAQRLFNGDKGRLR